MELLSFIFGGLFRLAPKVLEYQDKKHDRKHEKDMLELQLRADEARAKAEIQKLETQGQIQNQLEELKALVAVNSVQAQPQQLSGNKWLDGLTVVVTAASSLVRPLLTYWYCVAAYGSYKVASYYILLEQEVGWKDAVVQLWTPNDHAVMFSIIGFWFVDRALRKREGT